MRPRTILRCAALVAVVLGATMVASRLMAPRPSLQADAEQPGVGLELTVEVAPGTVAPSDCPTTSVVRGVEGAGATVCATMVNTSGRLQSGVAIVEQTSGRVFPVPGLFVDGGRHTVALPLTIEATARLSFVLRATSVTDQPRLTTSAPAVVVVEELGAGLRLDATATIQRECPGDDYVEAAPNTPVLWCFEVENSGRTDLADIVVRDGDGNELARSRVVLQPGQAVMLPWRAWADLPDLNPVASARVAASGPIAAPGEITDTDAVRVRRRSSDPQSFDP